jgi:hypothetical protein
MIPLMERDIATRSLSVNQYRWINIWMAILGDLFIGMPVFFDTDRYRQ